MLRFEDATSHIRRIAILYIAKFGPKNRRLIMKRKIFCQATGRQDSLWEVPGSSPAVELAILIEVLQLIIR
jgi:hypothetical protein